MIDALENAIRREPDAALKIAWNAALDGFLGKWFRHAMQEAARTAGAARGAGA